MGFPEDKVEISTPQHLFEVIRDAKQGLASGTLRQIYPPHVRMPMTDVINLPDASPWEDYVLAYFEDSQGTHYKLEVETYHGSGGTWERDLPPENDDTRT